MNKFWNSYQLVINNNLLNENIGTHLNTCHLTKCINTVFRPYYAFALHN